MAKPAGLAYASLKAARRPPRHRRGLVWLGVVTLVVCSLAICIAVLFSIHILGRKPPPGTPTPAAAPAAPPLRMMPLGASITWGTASRDGNGYRAALRAGILASASGLGAAGVDLVGSRQHGTMADNHVEGWPGATVAGVRGHAATAVPRLRPNVVLVHVGTNDCVLAGGGGSGAAAAAMGVLVDGLLRWSPGATVLLSSLIANAVGEECVVAANEQFRVLAAARRGAGARVVFVDMRDGGPGLEDLVDGTHPGDEGYGKMATVWLRGLEEAHGAGLIQAPDYNTTESLGARRR